VKNPNIGAVRFIGPFKTFLFFVIASLLKAGVAISGLLLGLQSLFKVEAQSEAKGKRGISLLAMTNEESHIFLVILNIRSSQWN